MDGHVLLSHGRRRDRPGLMRATQYALLAYLGERLM